MRITDNPQILSLASQQSILFFATCIKWSDYFSLLFPFVTSKWLLPLNLFEKTLLSESWWSVISIDREFHFFEAITSISIKKNLYIFPRFITFYFRASFYPIAFVVTLILTLTNYFIFSLFVSSHFISCLLYVCHHLYQPFQTHYIIPTRHFLTSYSSLHFISSFP